MNMNENRSAGTLSNVNPHYVATLAVALSPFGAIFGTLFTVHIVEDRVTAVWVSYAALMIIGTYVLSLSS